MRSPTDYLCRVLVLDHFLRFQMSIVIHLAYDFEWNSLA